MAPYAASTSNNPRSLGMKKSRPISSRYRAGYPQLRIIIKDPFDIGQMQVNPDRSHQDTFSHGGFEDLIGRNRKQKGVNREAGNTGTTFVI
ncbi:hypothetical protein CRG98_036047 [Punica granatum]|uniref:Uncharacterized protein n=1 Tax=Punica granatum TaxID=22663 RepID=A0A2I0IHT6_PUNGR|nr:hypothetical protein CRG98_036047 [Punica granatum]